MLTVNFAFSGTELIGITAGEAENPQKAIPEAIRTTLWRLIVFFIGSIVVMAALIPYHTAGVTQSPFVYVLDLIHVPFAANIMNFVVLTAIILRPIQVCMLQLECFGRWATKEQFLKHLPKLISVVFQYCH